MIHSYLKPLMHYASVGLLLVLVYFLGSSLMTQYQVHAYHGPQVVAVAPTPSGVGVPAQAIASAMNSTALAAALRGQAVQLNATQQTISSAVSSFTGAAARMSGAFAYGVTQGPPKVEVVTVATKAAPNATFTVASPGPNDDAIKRDMEEVLATTVVHAQVDTTVNVGFQSRPYSPFSAVYSSDGGSGVAFRLHHAPALDLNALALVHKNKPEVGFDFEHILKGTEAGVGLGATYNFYEHQATVQALVHIHMGN